MTEVTCVGLGLMGSALARALLLAGRGVTVWNRSPGKTEALAALGAREARSFAEALGASQVLLICIDNYASAHALLENAVLADRLAGRTIVSLTTGTPREAEALAKFATSRGLRYLDGAILCGPNEIGSRTGEILLSGDAAVWQAVEPLLSCLAGKVRWVGDRVGAASGLDFAWLTMSYVQIIGVAHAASICRAEAIDLQEFIGLFPHEPMRADSDTETCKLAGIIRDADYGRPTATLQVWGAALAHLQTQAREAGISPAVPDFIAGFFERAVSAGFGQEEAIAIYKTLGASQKPT